MGGAQYFLGLSVGGADRFVYWVRVAAGMASELFLSYQQELQTEHFVKRLKTDLENNG